MKVMLRKIGETYEIYVPKKDLEEKVVEMEKDTPWGGWIRIANGWTFAMPDMPADTRLPVTVEARRIGGEED
ncbi:putative nitrogen fixation protein NifT [Magnetospirillum sp. SS-4]|uniref:putative nitrogen fixation protein NifT n=1 Tax=Magnetospirillum sp. SS-4 TaxID=2681465 RepID=UPI00138280CA|nr:putative nitrogen fixation protein NifT [Magnetospirillum sp. SS-4]CAA7623658.1 Protein FixU homolog [Magnetospirillum sp. SS-4]